MSSGSILIGWQMGLHESIENIDSNCCRASFGPILLIIIVLLLPPPVKVLFAGACSIDENGVVSVLWAGSSRAARSNISASAVVLLLRLAVGGTGG